jgi:hypothetical protein
VLEWASDARLAADEVEEAEQEERGTAHKEREREIMTTLALTERKVNTMAGIALERYGCKRKGAPRQRMERGWFFRLAGSMTNDRERESSCWTDKAVLPLNDLIQG